MLHAVYMSKHYFCSVFPLALFGENEKLVGYGCQFPHTLLPGDTRWARIAANKKSLFAGRVTAPILNPDLQEGRENAPAHPIGY